MKRIKHIFWMIVGFLIDFVGLPWLFSIKSRAFFCIVPYWGYYAHHPFDEFKWHEVVDYE